MVQSSLFAFFLLVPCLALSQPARPAATPTVSRFFDYEPAPAARDSAGNLVSSGQWMVVRRPESTTGEVQTILVIQGDGRELTNADTTPLIEFACFRGTLTVRFFPGSFLGTVSAGNGQTRIRFNAAPARSEGWYPAGVGITVLAPDPEGFVAAVGVLDHVMLETGDVDGDPHRGVFDVRGLRDLLPEIASCRRASPVEPGPAVPRASAPPRR